MTPDARPDWDDYFLSIAHVVATRAPCTRRQVGAAIVRNKRIIATGYNGQPTGQTHCTDGGCPRGKLTADQLAANAGGYDNPDSPGYCTAVHAEANALLHASQALTGATVYVTDEPCHGCSKLLAAAGIARVVHP